MNEYDQPAFSTPPTEAGAVVMPADYTAVRVPILISGIFNCLLALGWLSTCFLFFVAIPVIVLAVFEFMLFVKLGVPGAGPRFKGQAKIIAILEICSILLGGLGQLVCGIIALVNLNKLDR